LRGASSFNNSARGEIVRDAEAGTLSRIAALWFLRRPRVRCTTSAPVPPSLAYHGEVEKPLSLAWASFG